MSIETFRSNASFPLRRHPADTPGRHLSRFVSYILACMDVARQRRQLRSLDANALKDIGISRADAHREASRSFWDIPEDLKPGA